VCRSGDSEHAVPALRVVQVLDHVAHAEVARALAVVPLRELEAGVLGHTPPFGGRLVVAVGIALGGSAVAAVAVVVVVVASGTVGSAAIASADVTVVVVAAAAAAAAAASGTVGSAAIASADVTPITGVRRRVYAALGCVFRASTTLPTGGSATVVTTTTASDSTAAAFNACTCIRASF